MASVSPIIELKKNLITNKVIYFDISDPLAKTSMKYNISQSFRNSDINASILEYVESFMEKRMENVVYTTVLPLNLTSIPFASDIATSLNKSLLVGEQTINGFRFSTSIDIDEQILLVVDTIRTEDDYKMIDAIIKKLQRFDAVITGILIIFDQDVGEYIKLNPLTQNIFSVFSFNDIAEIAYNNNMICQFEYEKYKFYSEKMVKIELIKLDVNIDNSKPDIE